VDQDGVVWLRTPAGERAVGSWQAGEPAEGLAHFARRFEDLATEVTILERRLVTGSGDARQTLESARALHESLPTAAVVGDVTTLTARLQELLVGSAQAASAARAERDAMRAQQAERKEVLATEAEQLAAESTQWKTAGDRMREIAEEWKTLRGLDRKTDDVLWKRYSRARELFNRRRGAHFAELDRERAEARSRKEELVKQAEALATSTEFPAAAAQYRELMTQWKAAGRAPRESEDSLWQRFKAAQDRFFAARNAEVAQRDEEFIGNGEAKRALLAEAEAIDPAADLDRARAALRSVQDRWDAVGKVPRELAASLEGRMRAVEDRVRDADATRWTRTDPESQARAQQFRSRVTQFEEQAAKARAGGDERRAVAAEEQAAQWREWAAAAEEAVRATTRG